MIICRALLVLAITKSIVFCFPLFREVETCQGDASVASEERNVTLDAKTVTRLP